MATTGHFRPPLFVAAYSCLRDFSYRDDAIMTLKQILAKLAGFKDNGGLLVTTVKTRMLLAPALAKGLVECCGEGDIKWYRITEKGRNDEHHK
jgi:hypothetical protein